MPTAAHKWIKEAKDLYGWEEKVHFNMTEENIETIRKWAPNFTEIGFFGGEPLMAKENIDLMRYCVEQGFSKNIRILLNTNGTVYTDEIVELFKHFKHVFLNFSIDDIGERFEYQRKNAKWDEVVENMRKYIAHGGHSSRDTIECKICCSVTNMNIYYFPEYFEFMNEHFPGMPVFWNLIYEPWQFSIEILPKEIKEIIQDRLKHFVKTTYKMDTHRTKTIEDLIIFLNNTVDKDFQGFFDKIEKHDIYRIECFAETFPEFWQLIAPFKKEISTQENYHMSPKPEIPNDKDYKQAFISEMEKFAEWKNVKHKIEELEEMVATIESPERMYHRFYNAPESAVLDACVKNDVNRLFEIYKENR
jgi:MoaA/NifB/PqqE/SkfB family radical SAM enzyme